MAGLLHDVGKIILDPYVHERKFLFMRYYDAHPDRTIHQAERDILGFDHAVIASILCESWNLPRSISFGIRHHHQPAATDGHQLAHIVHLADCLIARNGLGVAAGNAPFPPDEVRSMRVQISQDVLDGAVEKARQYVESLSGRFFGS